MLITIIILINPLPKKAAEFVDTLRKYQLADQNYELQIVIISTRSFFSGVSKIQPDW